MTTDSNHNKKWNFSDYAYTITGILVGLLLVAPEILYSQFGIRILGGSLSEAGVNQIRAFSPLLFLLTTTLVFCKDAIDARKTGGYKGSIFTHTFETLLEEAIYMAITTIMVYAAIFAGAMYISWLAGPITFVLFLFIFPLVRKTGVKPEKALLPKLLLLLLIIGIILEFITRAWIAFPLAWLIICAVKGIDILRKRNHSIDNIFNILYYLFSVILMALGITLDFWIGSWIAFPLAGIICWILSKFGRYKTPKRETN